MNISTKGSGGKGVARGEGGRRNEAYFDSRMSSEDQGAQDKNPGHPKKHVGGRTMKGKLVLLGRDKEGKGRDKKALTPEDAKRKKERKKQTVRDSQGVGQLPSIHRKTDAWKKSNRLGDKP